MMTSLRHKDFSSAPGNRRRSRLPRPEAEIRAELFGSDGCSAVGITVSAGSSVFMQSAIAFQCQPTDSSE